MTTTTAKAIVPQPKATTKKPMTKAHKAKLVSALEKWRASLSDEERAELKRRNREAQQARWDAMSDRERRNRLAGVKKWQAEQRAAKRAAAKAKAAPKANPTKAPRTAEDRTELGESAAPTPAPKRSRKAVPE